MPINVTNPVSVGAATKKDHYDRVFLNTLALKKIGTALNLGGSDHQPIPDTSFVPIPGGRVLEINGTITDEMTGFSIEVHATVFTIGGTGSIRLWDITAAAQIGSATTFTNTTVDVKKITGLDGLLVAGHKYRLEVKGAAAADLPKVLGASLMFF
jgi:hypothetical protein